MLEKFPDRRAPILAIDAGASKVDAVLLARNGALLGAARHHAYANFNLGHQPPLAALDEAIRLADGAAARALPVADIGVYCIAGADLPVDDGRISRQVSGQGWTRKVILRNDTFAVLRAGTDRGWGVAVVAGSGLNCAAIGPDRRVIRFPSLGDTSGDRAHGGGWLGSAAVGAAVRGRDGRGPRTDLERLVPEHFGMARPAKVMEAIYVGALSRGRLHELVPIVFKAARGGDAVSRGLIDELADEVVANANAAIRRLRMGSRHFEVILGGGVFRSGDGRLLNRIKKGITAIAPHAEMRRLDAPPVLGAALLGLDELRAGKAAHERLRRELTEKALTPR
ncbi:MAG TPA: BadF/BadG/BcrA/BcrD ATPase family protein [Candidatus Dormibacteraeota bacterium]|nr:BadF/BadG/BcrA/BcrD ATPase family protein [Candidatus Dormibacteraeota bacterium]